MIDKRVGALLSELIRGEGKATVAARKCRARARRQGEKQSGRQAQCRTHPRTTLHRTGSPCKRPHGDGQSRGRGQHIALSGVGIATVAPGENRTLYRKEPDGRERGTSWAGAAHGRKRACDNELARRLQGTSPQSSLRGVVGSAIRLVPHGSGCGIEMAGSLPQPVVASGLDGVDSRARGRPLRGSSASPWRRKAGARRGLPLPVIGGAAAPRRRASSAPPPAP